MEYVITTERSFGEIEAITRSTLERHGFLVQRTFSLHSATAAVIGQEQMEYSVFLVFAPGAGQRPTLLALYRRGAQMVINPMLSPGADADADAELVGALLLGDLNVCIDAGDGERCIELIAAGENLESHDDPV